MLYNELSSLKSRFQVLSPVYKANYLEDMNMRNWEYGIYFRHMGHPVDWCLVYYTENIILRYITPVCSSGQGDIFIT